MPDPFIGDAKEREPTADERRGMDWWNALSEAERSEWLRRAGSVFRGSNFYWLPR
jgi:hypothetical protein